MVYPDNGRFWMLTSIVCVLIRDSETTG